MTLYQRFDLFTSDALVNMYNALRRETNSRMDREDLVIITKILTARGILK